MFLTIYCILNHSDKWHIKHQETILSPSTQIGKLEPAVPDPASTRGGTLNSQCPSPIENAQLMDIPEPSIQGLPLAGQSILHHAPQHRLLASP